MTDVSKTTPYPKRNAEIAVALAAMVVAVFSLVPQGRAADLDAQSRALDLIQRQAVVFCNTVPLHGKSTSVELTGKAKADLDGLIRKLADLGFDGAGTLRTEEYDNVLRSDLGKALADNSQCRLNVLRLLLDRIVPPALPEISAEEVDWLQATETGTRSSYQAYYAKYPNGRHAKLALSKIQHVDEEGFELDDQGKRSCKSWGYHEGNWVGVHSTCKQPSGQWVQVN